MYYQQRKNYNKILSQLKQANHAEMPLLRENSGTGANNNFVGRLLKPPKVRVERIFDVINGRFFVSYND